jgi:two-component system response regulator YesN
LDKYIEQHLPDDLSLLRLAEIARFNPQYLSRLYKQVTGIGISDRILDLRLTEAMRLLDDTQSKIHDIAVKVGFQLAPYFTRFFKKQTGLTPQEYRTSRTIIK